MPADPKAIYDSGFHHPLVAYVAGFALLAWVARRLRFFEAYLTVFGVSILADALVTGAWSPVRSSSPLFTPLSILFVVLGDLRVFVLAERLLRPDATAGSLLRIALPVTLLVPVITGVGSRVIPFMASPRGLFLVYEVMLFGLVLALLAVRYGAQAPSARARRALREVLGFVAVQYAGWALADVVLLTGAESGHLARLVPNVLYYGAFLPFVAWRVPAELLEPEART